LWRRRRLYKGKSLYHDSDSGPVLLGLLVCPAVLAKTAPYQKAVALLTRVCNVFRLLFPGFAIEEISFIIVEPVYSEEKLATALPCWVYLSSGSLVKRP